MKIYFILLPLLVLCVTGCAGGKSIRLKNEIGIVQTCEVSSYTALVTGSGSRDAVLGKCINQLQNAGFKVIDSK